MRTFTCRSTFLYGDQAVDAGKYQEQYTKLYVTSAYSELWPACMHIHSTMFKYTQFVHAKFSHLNFKFKK